MVRVLFGNVVAKIDDDWNLRELFELLGGYFHGLGGVAAAFLMSLGVTPGVCNRI